MEQRATGKNLFLEKKLSDCASLRSFSVSMPAITKENQCSFDILAVADVAELHAEEHLQLLQILVHLLPPANVLLLKHLLGLLRRVCEQKETRMTPASLGRLFAPHLLIPRAVSAHSLSNITQCN